MRIKNNINRLIALCISAFFIVSCEEPSDVGYNLQQNDGILNAELVEVPLSVQTVLANDEINSSNTSILLAGAFSDGDLGNTSASAYFQLLQSDLLYDFGTNPIVDSVKLYLRYAGYYYGDTTQNQTLEVYSLAEAFLEDSTYNTNDDLATDVLLGSLAFTAAPYALTDTGIVISLNTSFGDDIITNAGVDNSIFTNNIKGLKVSALNDNEGAVLGFSAASSLSDVEIFYHNDTDTSTYTLNINTGQRFNHIESDRGSTVISSLVSHADSISSVSTGGIALLQSGVGLRGMISFSALSDMRDSLNNVVINKAELILSTVAGSYSGEADEPSPSLILYFFDQDDILLKDENGDFSLIVGDESFIDSFGFELVAHSYDENSEKYTISLTTFINDYFLGNHDEDVIIVSPANNAISVNKTLIYDNDFADQSKKMTLRVYYTYLN